MCDKAIVIEIRCLSIIYEHLLMNIIARYSRRAQKYEQPKKNQDVCDDRIK
jgi:hypothetical protein